MRLIHWSDKPVRLGDLIARGQDEYGAMKPNGFWVSDEDAECSWRWWCIQEGFRLDLLTHMHEVTLSNSAEVLCLKSKQEIREFGIEFAVQHGPFAERPFRSAMHLDWVRVIQKWHGLVITPYVWEARLADDCFWYYGWDCASGVIWHPGAIGSVILREIVEAPQPAYPREEPDADQTADNRI